jgi:hypothetical protein
MRSNTMRVTATQTKAGLHEFNAPLKCIPPMLCIYHVLIIGVVFVAYLWLDMVSSSMVFDLGKYY